MWLGLPCSSYIWISRGTTWRCRLRPKGSKRFPGVRKANKLVRRVCYLLLVFCVKANLLLRYLLLWNKRDISSHVYVSDSPQVGVFAEKGRDLCDRTAFLLLASIVWTPRGSILLISQFNVNMSHFVMYVGAKGSCPRQDLLKRHSAVFYRLPLGMKGGSTQRHGCI